MKKLIVSLAFLSAGMVYAGGFRVSLQGVKQLAMAHTSAHTEDASVAFFNPAGIAFVPAKLSIAGGGFGAKTVITYQNPSTGNSYETQNPLGTPFYAALSYRVAPNISVGLSVSTPFGSTVKWADDWAGREIVQKMALKSFYFQPMVAFKISPEVAIGASYIYAKGSVDWERAATQLGGTLHIEDKKASGQGFGLGFYMKPDENWDISVAYRSPVNVKADNGTATFKVPASLFPVLGLSSAGTDSFKATLPLVDEYTLGFTFKATPRWSLSADFNYTGWERYNSLKLDFANAPVGNQKEDPTVSVTPKNYHNTKTFRFGTQYMLTDKFAGRLGYYYDESPYDDEDFAAETPSFNANVLTAGFGYRFSPAFVVDVAAGLSFPKAREVANSYYNFNGQAKAKAFYFGLGLSYNVF